MSSDSATNFKSRCRLGNRILSAALLGGMAVLGSLANSRPAQAANFDIPAGDVTALRAALTASNGNGQSDVIYLAPNSSYLLTTPMHTDDLLGGSGLLINHDGGRGLRISGNGSTIERSFDDGTPRFRLIRVAPGAVVLLEGLTLLNGHSDFVGGGVYSEEATLELFSCAVNLNTSETKGGGIANLRGSLTATHTSFVQNYALNGGAILNGTGSNSGTGTSTLNLGHCTFTSNSAFSFGGGIWNAPSPQEQSNATIDHCSFSANTASFGGAILSQGMFPGPTATLTAKNSTFQNNVAGNSGGALGGSSTPMDLQNCVFDRNVATAGNGGAIDGTAIARSCGFSNNRAQRSGGAIHSIDLQVFEALFTANLANETGGAVDAVKADLTGCTFLSNTAGQQGGALQLGALQQLVETSAVTRSLFQENTAGGNGTPGIGGGIDAVETEVRVTDCTFDRNWARGGTESRGGAISSTTNQNLSRLTVTNSTFRENKADGRGGSVFQSSGAGTARTTVTNTTFSRSSAPNGASLANATVGGTAEVRLGNTILEAVLTGPNVQNVGGEVLSLGYNLASDAAGGFLTGTGDQVSTDPMLDPAGLQDNGATIRTVAPEPGSPAIDQGKNLARDANDVLILVDQRGRGRGLDFPQVPDATGGDSSDIGAVEVQDLQAGPDFVVNTVTDHDDTQCTDADCTLHEAIEAANAFNIANDSPGASITFKASVFADAGPQVIELTEALPAISTQVRVTGPGADLLTIQRSSAQNTPDFRILKVGHGLFSLGPEIHLQGLTLAKGHPTGNLLSENSGGAIYNDHGQLTVEDCELKDNTANLGGGIYNSGVTDGSASVTLLRSTLSGNTATGDGGALYNHGFQGDVSAMIANTTFSGNSAQNGGAIASFGVDNGTSELLVHGSTFSGNSATQGGDLFNVGLVSGTATATFGNSILASTGSLVNDGGTVVSLGYNLSVGDGGGFLTASGDQTSANPQLGPLQMNQGTTRTHALQAGSPALDRGKSFGYATDQRDLERPSDHLGVQPAAGGDNSDIGAFELAAPPTMTPTPTSTPIGGTSTPTPTGVAGTPTSTRTPGGVPVPAMPSSGLLGLLPGLLFLALCATSLASRRNSS